MFKFGTRLAHTEGKGVNMKTKSNTFIVFLVIHLFCLTSCGGSMSSVEDLFTPTEKSQGENGESEIVVDPFSLGSEYLTMPTFQVNVLDPEVYPSMSTLMDMAAGFTKAFDPKVNFPIDWEDEVHLPILINGFDIDSIRDENKQPNGYGCAIPLPSDEGDTFTTGGKGTNLLPVMDESWAGSQTGGCGTWATAMCNRILGIEDAGSEVDKDEWNKIAGGIGQNATGGSKQSDQSKYYEDQGYCVHDKGFSGSSDDYAEMVERINQGCDVKLFFWKRNADGTYSNGHVETVTEADANAKTAKTNSWGKDATVSGGSDGGFDHSLDGTQFQDGDGNEMWPAGATEVRVSYVCECGFFEGVAKALGF